MSDKSVLYRDADGDWRWQRTAPNGEEVGASTEGYVLESHARENYARINGDDAPELEEETEASE